VFQSKPQKYGTQLIPERRLYPVENKENINEERIKVSLPPLSPEDINRIPASEDIPEMDAREKEYTLWREKVGWI
jgi:hypothetical protein